MLLVTTVNLSLSTFCELVTKWAEFSIIQSGLYTIALCHQACTAKAYLHVVFIFYNLLTRFLTPPLLSLSFNHQFAQNFNLPIPEKDGRRAILPHDEIDGYPRVKNMPEIEEIIEVDADYHNDYNTDYHNDYNHDLMAEGDREDPDFEPEYTSARSRGNVIRKRKGVGEKRNRSGSRGRKTRSQAAKDNERLLNLE